MITKLLVSALTLFFVNQAHAGALLEPYLGYAMGQIKSTSASTGNVTTSDNNNMIVGARAAYVFTVAMVGLDYAMTVSGKAKNTSTGSEYDWNASTLWLIAGAQMPLLRAYAGYGVLNSGESKTATTTTLVKGGDAIKLGASYTGFPLVALNAEYWMNSYKKLSINNGNESDIPNSLISKITNDLIVISVSMPLDL